MRRLILDHVVVTSVSKMIFQVFSVVHCRLRNGVFISVITGPLELRPCNGQRPLLIWRHSIFLPHLFLLNPTVELFSGFSCCSFLSCPSQAFAHLSIIPLVPPWACIHRCRNDFLSGQMSSFLGGECKSWHKKNANSSHGPSKTRALTLVPLREGKIC